MSTLAELLPESRRQFAVCNACRYCEDYCAVFPAMERRSVFTSGDLAYLATVCHDCRACYQACMYSEPHEWAINIPVLMSEARLATYREHARPRWLAVAFGAGPRVLGLLTLLAIGLFAVFVEVLDSAGALTRVYRGPGSFYAVVSHAAMVVPAMLLSGFFLLVAGWGFVGYWRAAGAPLRELLEARLWRTALQEVASLRWMRGGGGECHFPDELHPSAARRRWHQLVVAGFMSAFAATVSAFLIEELLGRLPPYPFLSVPVVLGLTGGIALVIGCSGLMLLERRAPPTLTTPDHRTLDWTFLWSLLLVALTGLALLGLRAGPLMPVLLIVHLAAVAALYVLAPYGKFLHAVYRTGALVLSAHERDHESHSNDVLAGTREGIDAPG